MTILPKIAKDIINEYDQKTLPNAILLLGEKFSSKKVSALELAKKILKEKTLTSPNLLIFSNFDTVETKAHLATNSQKIANKYLEYIKTVIFTKCYFSNEKNLKKIEKNINYINSVYYKKEHNINIKNELIKNIENINKEISHSITVYDIKKIQAWIFSEKEKPKVIYINEIENLSFNVHNSLLKILEEPPSNIYFILAARNKNKIPKTILSRLRIYNFTKSERSLEIQRFKESFLINKEITIEEYFASFYKEERKKIKKELIKILNIIKEKKSIFNLEKIDFIKDDQNFKMFLNELTINIREDFLENKININQYLKYTKYLKNIYKYRPYNQNKKLIIENLMLNYEEI
ncbi:DNA polymerase III subunit gamma/tau [Borreliella chilensis]|uniref:DNA polymerase III subunit gamma/tau n=1 Tax=Borreliella chilensis TaxID=1245910 RepID=A0A0A7UWU4_9SPIR|nr:DNA polymerase III subunit gamma/tau [Borreliella chilensis]